MHVLSIDPILLFGLILVALLFWLCVFLDNMFRKERMQQGNKRNKTQRRKKQRQQSPKHTARHLHIHLHVK